MQAKFGPGGLRGVGSNVEKQERKGNGGVAAISSAFSFLSTTYRQHPPLLLVWFVIKISVPTRALRLAGQRFQPLPKVFGMQLKAHLKVRPVKTLLQGLSQIAMSHRDSLLGRAQ
ncbi:unnamed protein product [Albugo candida]|uniref:Uncharacterized protein n=1 Tax=Albugo candida TaxID=65357 RepID=A0A024GVX4_9STRA|nr:unnamed protein product [Albugo candida]|eukprot:CCI50935.1 unnamed protein product [Albugo candida]